MLASEPGIRIVGEGASGHDALRIARDTALDVLLLDLDMPGMGGIEATRLIAAGNTCRVVALTVSEDPDDVADAMLAGASGYCVKGASARQIAFAVRSAAAGQVFVSPVVARRLLSRWRPGIGPVPNTDRVELSQRELEVLRLLVRGEENNAIAAALHISPNTVRRHVQSILEKLGADNRTQAAVTAIREGLA